MAGRLMGGLERFFPWGVGAAVRLVLLSLAAGIALVVVWVGVSGQGVFQHQVGWLTAGIGALLLALYALGSLVIRGRRAVGERRRELLCDRVADLLPRPLVTEAEHGFSQFVVVEGLDLLHRAWCPMVADRRVTVLAAEATAGLGRCGICTSDELVAR